MKAMGVLEAIHPALTEVEVEKRLSNYEHGKHFYALMRLVALLPEEDETLKILAKDLSLTRRESNQLEVLSESLDPSGANDPDWHRAIKKQSWETVRARLCITAARNEVEPNLDFAGDNYPWDRDEFPLKGKDVMVELNITEGHEVGEILRQIEDIWLSENCSGDKQACLHYLYNEYGEEQLRPRG